MTGVMVCRDCGAAMPGNDVSVLKDVKTPYKSKYRCNHPNSFNVFLGYDFITDMLALIFPIDDNFINGWNHNPEKDGGNHYNLWIERAAQSLAEALRLTASNKLDVDFTELVTGYRLRKCGEIYYVDIYLYDSLSSGAGYAARVAESIKEILSDIEILLSSCNCDSACFKCLKHYQNRFVHGTLDRNFALQLLQWGIKREIVAPIEPEIQFIMMSL